MKSIRRKFRSGAAAVEMAMVLPLFLLILFGMVEMGRAFMAQHLLSEASRLGARRAIVEGVSNSEIKNAVRDFCAETLGARKNKIKVDIRVTGPDSDSDDSHGNIRKAKSGDMCRVTVTIPFDEVSLLPAQFLKKAELSNTCVMEHE